MTGIKKGHVLEKFDAKALLELEKEARKEGHNKARGQINSRLKELTEEEATLKATLAGITAERDHWLNQRSLLDSPE